MELKQVKSLLERHDGNHAQFADILGERLDVYSDYEVPFRSEFLFFEDTYLTIKKHMIENKIKQNVVDIGCQFGLQSELFIDADSYLGIDCIEPSHFMNSDKPNINYIIGMFPNVNVDLRGKTVISSMSLGYFDMWINENEEQAQMDIVEKLKSCSVLYTTTKRSLINKLSPYFKITKTLRDSRAGDFHLYFLQK